MDRIDIHLEVASVEVDKLAGLATEESSSVIRQRVEVGRAIQQARFDQLNKPGGRCNDDMGPGEVQQFCELDKESRAMMRLAVERMGLSARAYHRVLMLGRTIADLAGSEGVRQAHLAEALQYRPRSLTQIVSPLELVEELELCVSSSRRLQN
jgi:magnesium chelatase family protein